MCQNVFIKLISNDLSLYIFLMYILKYPNHRILNLNQPSLASLTGTDNRQLLSPDLVCGSAAFTEMSWLGRVFGCSYIDVKFSGNPSSTERRHNYLEIDLILLLWTRSRCCDICLTSEWLEQLCSIVTCGTVVSWLLPTLQFVLLFSYHFNSFLPGWGRMQPSFLPGRPWRTRPAGWLSTGMSARAQSVGLSIKHCGYVNIGFKGEVGTQATLTWFHPLGVVAFPDNTGRASKV